MPRNYFTETSLNAWSSNPWVSIIILSWNGMEYIKNCLDSVLESDYPRFEVIVVDNASTDGTPEFLRKNYPDVTVISNNKNLGFSEGNNEGIKKAKGEIVILLNQDTTVNQDWITEIVKASSDPTVGVVGCKIYHKDTNFLQNVGFYLYPSGHHYERGPFQRDEGQFDKLCDVDYVMGAAIAIKKSVANTIKLLDPRFFAYFEEVDWCYRARQKGYRVIVAPRACIHHFGSASWGKTPLRMMYLNELNRLHFLCKHFSGADLVRRLTICDFRFLLVKFREITSRSLVIQKRKDLEPISGMRSGTAGFLLNLISSRALAYGKIAQEGIKHDRRNVSS